MRAVNLIPAEQRGGAGAGAGRSGGGRLRRARPARRAGGLRAALRQRRPSDLQPQVPGRLAHRPGAAGAGARRRSSLPTRASPRCANSASRPSPQLVDSRFDWAHAFHELGRVLPQQRLARLAERHGRLGGSAHPPPPRASTTASADRGDAASAVSLRDPTRQRPHVHAHRLRHQPGRGRADARPPAPDRRRQRSDAAELHQGRRGGGGGGSAGVRGSDPVAFAVQVAFDALPTRRRDRLSCSQDRRPATRLRDDGRRPTTPTGGAHDDRPRSHRRDRARGARRARRRVAARRLARAREGRQAGHAKSAPRRRSSRAPKASSPAPARRRRSTRPPTPRS